jgi:proline iminopeptidase
VSLAYAQRHPERVSELVLRGIFLLRREELRWFYQGGCSWIFPEAFEEFKRLIPEEERGDLIAAYHRRLTGSDRGAQIAAARAWSVWEGSTLSLLQDPERVRLFGADSYAIAFARIECHYFINRGFFERDDELVIGAARIRHLPCAIVHGRYDVVTPVKNAWDLARVWPEAELRIVADAGHAMTEPGTVHELVAATRRFAAR